MSNDPQTDLIYAILALDSYNRGYGTGITGLDRDQEIGPLKILNFDLPAGSFDAGFYGIAYQNDDQVIISYRGTDVKLGSSDTKGGNDPVNGYGIALGLTDVLQASLATQFYDAVAGADYGQTINITLTGHSLGGGLAGYVGAHQGRPQLGDDRAPIRRADEGQQVHLLVEIAAHFAIECHHLLTADNLRRLTPEDDIVGVVSRKPGEVGAVERGEVGLEPGAKGLFMKRQGQRSPLRRQKRTAAAAIRYPELTQIEVAR